LLYNRWRQPVARQVAVLSIVLVIVLAGPFDASTTRELSQVWLGMVVVTALLLLT
jgi:hypothetical protein